MDEDAKVEDAASSDGGSKDEKTDDVDQLACSATLQTSMINMVQKRRIRELTQEISQLKSKISDRSNEVT